jgi:glyoxylase-like metal-dependent hydrolase (beta-lactamase superfamily II)
MKFKFFTGGPLATNAWFLETGSGNLLFDAPEGADRHFAGNRIDWLVLTHGHFDHVTDAAAIHRRHGCRVACHPDTVPMVADGRFFSKLGFPYEFEPVAADCQLTEGGIELVEGVPMRVLEVPGHCPGSLCFYFPSLECVVGGDVLFQEGVGRWDLLGGDGRLLLDGIRGKLFALPGPTRVLTGHGPETTIAHEKQHNPYVSGN